MLYPILKRTPLCFSRRRSRKRTDCFGLKVTSRLSKVEERSLKAVVFWQIDYSAFLMSRLWKSFDCYRSSTASLDFETNWSVFFVNKKQCHLHRKWEALFSKLAYTSDKILGFELFHFFPEPNNPFFSAQHCGLGCFSEAVLKTNARKQKSQVWKSHKPSRLSWKATFRFS